MRAFEGKAASIVFQLRVGDPKTDVDMPEQVGDLISASFARCLTRQ